MGVAQSENRTNGIEVFDVAFIGLHEHKHGHERYAFVIFSNEIKLMIKIVQRDVIKYLVQLIGMRVLSFTENGKRREERQHQFRIITSS